MLRKPTKKEWADVVKSVMESDSNAMGKVAPHYHGQRRNGKLVTAAERGTIKSLKKLSDDAYEWASLDT